MPRGTPAQDKVVEFVRKNPGCIMIEAARYLSPRNHILGYRVIHRALRAGKLRREKRYDWGQKTYRLFINE